MELNLEEALTNNVLGMPHLMEAAAAREFDGVTASASRGRPTAARRVLT